MSFAEQLIENVEVRRHNGQCAYGPWMAATSEDVPGWVGEMVADEIAENGGDEGRIEDGGSIWLWRKVEADVVYVVRDAAGDYIADETGTRRTPASDEAYEFDSREEAASACTRMTDRVLSREVE